MATRTRLGWTQTELAAALGVGLRTLRRWETNEAAPQGFKFVLWQLDQIEAEHGAPRQPGRPPRKRRKEA